MNLLNQMEIFYQVALKQSFSKAASALGLSKGYVSLQINAMETELGTKLLVRSTRQVSLTEAGHQFLISCTKIMRERDMAKSVAMAMKAAPAGRLKISAPPSLSATYLADVLPRFMQNYPQIQIEVDSSSHIKDLLNNGIDLALRITAKPAEEYVARFLTTFKYITCATPSYLKEFGTPNHPQDLLTHNCLIYSADPAGKQWLYENKQGAEEIVVKGNLLSANVHLIYRALLAGLGIAHLPEYVVASAVKNNALSILMTDYQEASLPIYAIYPSAAFVSPNVKVFLAFLQEGF